MPPKDSLRLHQHPSQRRLGHQSAEGGQDQPVSRLQAGPLDLAPEDAELVTQQDDLCIGMADAQAHARELKDEPQARVDGCEEHRDARSYRPTG